LKSLLAIVVAILMVFTVFLVITPAVAAPNENASEKAKVVTEFAVPEHAKEISSGVFSLGMAIHNGKIVEGVLSFHHRPGHGGGPPGSGDSGSDTESTNPCFSTFTKGAKWRTQEQWNVDPSGIPANVSFDFVKSDLAADMTTWEVSDGTTNFEIFGTLNKNIVVDGPDSNQPDGKNEVLFGNISTPGVIAFTITWYESRGPPQSRDIVEWDQVYDNDFAWSQDALNEDGKQFDFASIATHELGHALGLGHPDDSCTEETMYRFGDVEETHTRTLAAGDIAGVQQIYG